MPNNTTIACAAAMWHDAYPRSNFYASDTTNQRKWIAIAEKVINSTIVRYADGFSDGVSCYEYHDTDAGKFGD